MGLPELVSLKALPELAGSRRPPDAVLVNDVSLREGQQSDGISFSEAVNVELALVLEAPGVRQAQVGYPGRSVRTSEALRRAEAAAARPRADPHLFEECWQAAAGAKRLYVADSMGAATPELIAWLVTGARETTGLPVGVHCHNDFGLIVGNTLSGRSSPSRCCRSGSGSCRLLAGS